MTAKGNYLRSTRLVGPSKIGTWGDNAPLTSFLLAVWVRFLFLLGFFLGSAEELAELVLAFSTLTGSSAFFSGSRATGVGGSSSSGGRGSGSR